MKNKVSVAMATYNGERFLREQLDSLYSQTRMPDEIVVVDDCSVDGTINILKEYHKSRGLKFFVNQENLGVNANFMKAISLCTGDYICICDQDDIWLPYKIEKTLKKLREVEQGLPAIVSSQNDNIDSNGISLKRKVVRPDTYNYVDSILKRNTAQGCTMILNRKLADIVLALYQKNGIEIDLMYDAYIAFIAVMVGYKYNMGMVTLKYRHHDKNVCGRQKRTENKTMHQRFHEFWIFDSLIPEDRIPRLEYVYQHSKMYVFNPKIGDLIEKLISLKKNQSFTYGLRIIFSLSELTVSCKIRVIANSIYRYIGRKIF